MLGIRNVGWGFVDRLIARKACGVAQICDIEQICGANAGFAPKGSNKTRCKLHHSSEFCDCLIILLSEAVNPMRVRVRNHMFSPYFSERVLLLKYGIRVLRQVLTSLFELNSRTKLDNLR